MKWLARPFRWIAVALTGVARWEGGDAARCRARTKPMVAGLFGSDRVRPGSSLSMTFYYDRLGASAYSFDLTFRFRMPDGALKSAWLSVPCNP